MKNETQQEGGPDFQTTKMPIGTKICIFILVIICIIYVFGCSGDYKTKDPINNKDTTIKWDIFGVIVLPVKGCQYVIFQGKHGGVAMLHAENCINPEHKMK